MNPLKRIPRLNNLWMDIKHRTHHYLQRRNRDIQFEATAENPLNVLVVVIDCLRADHVSGFGHCRETTPTLDNFDSAFFTNAKAPSPWTFPSVPSLLSGRYPHEHGACFDSDPRDLSTEQFPRRPNSEVAMLPDLLEAAGYDTGMITAIPMAEKAVGDRFQHVSVQYKPAKERVSTAIDWVDDREQWFCYLHLGDPHAPLDIPDRYLESFDVGDNDDVRDWKYRNTTEGDGFDSYRDTRIRAYDAAIRGVDDALNDLLGRLDDDTVVIVCGDHGEAFWEHPKLERQLNDDPRGYYGTDHGHSVLEEVTRVPLWIRAPGIDHTVSDQPVSLVDVMPTVLSVLGVNGSNETSGDPLTQAIENRTCISEETAYGYNQRALWKGDLKVITVPETGTTVAFDLDGYSETAPLESVPEHLETALSSFSDTHQGEDRMTVDSDTRDRLEELGYLE